jgi:hypothetical protein
VVEVWQLDGSIYEAYDALEKTKAIELDPHLKEW